METPEPVAHGALDHAELAALGLCPETLLDFSSNLNPFGPPPGVRAALAALDPAPYPDRSCHRLRLDLAAYHQCAPAALLPGNGANELIHLTARALLRPGDRALVAGPSYGEYAQASRLAGAEVLEARAAKSAAPWLDLEALDMAVRQIRPRITWLCTPNNPTGDDAPPVLLARLAATCARHGGLLLLDRSYAALRRAAPAASDEQPAAPNLIAIHSLTKSFALAGLRLGYLLAAPALLERVGAYQPAWSVSSAAQAAGLAALADESFLATSVPRLWAASDALLEGLRALGLTVQRAALPFMLVQTGAGAATRAAMLRRGIVLRDCASVGLPAWVRVAPRRPEENARLLTAWGELI
jgi:histidinol-phosphate/aromatic aminotransferase/cobyric acid decarboxylase-like protein